MREKLIISDHGLKAAHIKVNQWVSALPVRSDLHLLRKFWHMTVGLISIAIYMSGITQSTALICVGTFLAISIVAETMRLRNPVFNEKCLRFFSPLMRANEVNRLSGMIYYVASTFVAVAIFPKPVAVLSLLYLAVSDPLASLVGILYGQDPANQIFKGKSLQGTAAGFAVCAVITWLFLSTASIHGLNLIRLTLLGGFAGAIAELLPLELDDNFTIPIVSGFILWLGFLAIHFI